MADYFSPTVIQQPIPIADMTPLERLVLSLIFDAEPDGEALYFHTSLGPSDAIGLSIDELRVSFEASAAITGTATTYVAERLAAVPADETEIEIDFSGTPGSSSSRTSCAAPQRSATSQPSRLSPVRRCGPTASAAWRC